MLWEIGYGGYKVNIPPTHNVIDIGSGNNPHKRANVLVERNLFENFERSGEEAVIPENQDLIIADVITGLPFKDKSFDFAIASHIAEHVNSPDIFCNEITRIAKSGYIETPGFLSEVVLNEPFHKWNIRIKGNIIIFRKKRKFSPIFPLFYRIYYYGNYRESHDILLFNNRLIHIFFLGLKICLNRIWKYLPFTYVRFNWNNEIKYRVVK